MEKKYKDRQDERIFREKSDSDKYVNHWNINLQKVPFLQNLFLKSIIK